jgi:CheY-like chemotaxis protein
MAVTSPRILDNLVQSLGVLIVEDNAFMRQVIRGMLSAIGVRRIGEAANGAEGLEAVRTFAPDVMLLDWRMPLLDGPEVVRIVRSPGVFPRPNLPIVVLTAHGERRRVAEAVALGINEFLVKPISAQALHDRLMTLVTVPRPIVRHAGYYGPGPRRAPPKANSNYWDVSAVA